MSIFESCNASSEFVVRAPFESQKAVVSGVKVVIRSEFQFYRYFLFGSLSDSSSVNFEGADFW